MKRIPAIPPSKPAPKSTYKPSIPPAQPQKKLVSHFKAPPVVEPPPLVIEQPIKHTPIPINRNIAPLNLAKQTNSTILRASSLLSKKLSTKSDAHITLFDGEALRNIEQKKLEDAERAEALREKTRLEVLIGREIAIEKKKETELIKSEFAAQGKQESLELAKLREEESKLEVEKNRQLIKAIQVSEEAAKEAVKKATEEKQKLAVALAQEHDRAVKQAQHDAEVERLQRVELMKQIKAMEAKAKEEKANKPKEVDLTSPERGLMGEMSITELQARLTELKTEEEEAQQKRREDILALRQQQAAAMARKVRELEMYQQLEKERSQEASASASVNVVKRNKTVDPTIEKMRQELERRKAERLGIEIAKVEVSTKPQIIVSIKNSKRYDAASIQRSLTTDVEVT